jgi:hypothetical protein
MYLEGTLIGSSNKLVSEDDNEVHPEIVNIERSPAASMRARGLINLNISTS